MALGCGEPTVVAQADEHLGSKPQSLSSVRVTQALAAGAYHSLFLNKHGEVWAWGQNGAGQLGTGATSSTAQPSLVPGIPPIKALAAGIAHSVALDVSGNVWAWGQNTSGQAGLGSTGGSVLVPTRVAALSDIQAIAANGNYSLALSADGRLWAWGQNTSGQIGTGATSAAVATPVVVPHLPTLRVIAAGINHAMALDADGGVWAWGQNTFGQVGTGATSATVLSPVLVTGIPRATAVAAGSGHSLIVDAQFGNVWGWGQNNFGQVGTGIASTSPVLAPTPVSGVFAVTALVAGHNSSFGIIGNGVAMAWGHNASGQLGNGTTTHSATPVNVAGLSDARALAAGAQHVLAVRPGCPVWAWGNNGQGQLGTGSTTPSTSAAPVSTTLTQTFYFDGDQDGFGDEFLTEQACEPSPGFVQEIDCNDYMSTTYPGAPEVCNGTDDNCDGEVDDGNPSGGESCATGQLGVCATGTTACTEGNVVCQQNQSASEEQCDGLDNDCDGSADDGNPGGLAACTTGAEGVCGAGVTYCTHGAIECAPVQGPSTESCDSLDNDCDGTIDEGVKTTFYRDADGDSFGSPSQTTQACSAPAGYVANASDCDDGNAGTRPGASETCDGVDNNCNGTADEGAKTTFYRDADGDSFGSPSQTTQACSVPGGYVANASDCDDGNAGTRPGASEVCDSVDNNCNGTTDEGVKTTFYRDADGDSFGSPGQTTQACSVPGGYVTNASDCNDGNAGIRPGASEVCDSVDNNCNGTTDEGVKTTFYRDADADSFGNPSQTTQACSVPGGYVTNASDCDDGNAGTRPGASEVCDSVDNNCNGTTDEGVKTTFYRDADSDSFGSPSQTTQACSVPGGYVANASDCNDGNASIRPGASEVCDSVDNNCNGTTDEGVKTTFYRDADADSFGSPSQTTQACAVPGGYVTNASDCDDGNAGTRPGASEVCDGVDNNCDTLVDANPGGFVCAATDLPLVATGASHSIVVRHDGTVRACGRVSDGQLGDGIIPRSLTPVQTRNLTGVVALAAGDAHTVAVRQDGTVWAWGYNTTGWLGDGTSGWRSSPTQVQNLSGVTAVAAGLRHTVARRQDGTVWTWGSNNYGQLGDGTGSGRPTPVQVQNLTGVTMIAAHWNHTLVLRQDGTVWAWGDNYYGQLGDGTTTERPTPVQVHNLSGVTAIAAGWEHNMALKADGTVWAWGDNGDNQLGDGTTIDRLTPIQVPGLSGVTALAAGWRHSMALKADGTVWTWGSNFDGQLGDGTGTSRTTPVRIQGLSDVRAIATGANHSLARRQDGTTWTWGDNAYGQIGDGTTTDRSAPVRVQGVSSIMVLAAGREYSVALRQDGIPWAWGNNVDGQLGDGFTHWRTHFVQAAGLTGVTTVAAGDDHSLALRQDGTVWAWGSNAFSSLGDGTSIDRATPAQIQVPSGLTAITAGRWHSAALRNDGTVWAWGLDETASGWRRTPTQVQGLSGATAIAAGDSHTVVLRQDGTVWAWGDNWYGQLGDGTTTKRSSSVQAQGLYGVKAIAAGSDHTVALRQDGTVWTWGDNVYGQLGDGTTIDHLTPVQVQGLSGVVAIAAGDWHTVALRQDGSLWAWGGNHSSQLGDGTTTSRTTPVKVLGVHGVIALAAHGSHTVVMRPDGTLSTWGANGYGQLCDGTTTSRSTPVHVPVP
ncbi:hypothetical protein FJV41_19030 [Myxococcus llanfairpwllgwyngyllgogerychwyrndrobwllllantysiliogogogochensis]|uniref:RCC1-like domain-containing protein n=1 Tax=Myxococcus llanfairpwllgwyngyllgogerychwyrndrobwllllantysiliogogogochensis TaxID=2590453 RepID=A0A540WZL7_9BACT|nr:hypothetical protein FJV41_19030 [Myxococcus llanfairpwllgwyngyllgogerychwyrndrobwllllantysiliogogogochensis]